MSINTFSRKKRFPAKVVSFAGVGLVLVGSAAFLVINDDAVEPGKTAEVLTSKPIIDPATTSSPVSALIPAEDVKASPGNPEENFAKGVQARNEGDFTAAAAYFKSALNSNQPQVRQRAQESLDTLSRQASSAPEPTDGDVTPVSAAERSAAPDAVVGSGQVQQGSEEAVEGAQQAPQFQGRIAPGDPGQNLDKGLQAHSQGDIEGALEFYRSAVNSEDINVQVRARAMINAVALSGEEGAALMILPKASEITAGTTQILHDGTFSFGPLPLTVKAGDTVVVTKKFHEAVAVVTSASGQTSTHTLVTR